MNGPARVLVYSANGVQGSAVVRQLKQRGYSVRALVRGPARNLNVETAKADLRDLAGLRAAHAGMDYAVLQMPLSAPSQVAEFMGHAIEAIKSEKLKGVIAKMASAKPGMKTDEPSFHANEIIEDKLRISGVPFSIIRPTMYLDNMLKADPRSSIMEKNVISLPIAPQQKVAWTSADDVAKATAILLDAKAFGCEHLISASKAVDGNGLAAAFSRALNRQMTFESIPLDIFEQEIDWAMGNGVGKRVASKFRFFGAFPAEASKMLATEFVLTPNLAGFEPTSIESWVEERQSMFSS